MKLDAQYLLWIPILFVERPELLDKVLALEIITEETDSVSYWRKFYTDCDCIGGHFYWQREDIEDNDVEILACDVCGNWSMSVTY